MDFARQSFACGVLVASFGIGVANEWESLYEPMLPEREIPFFLLGFSRFDHRESGARSRLRFPGPDFY